MKISVNLSRDETKRLKAVAAQLGVKPENLARAVLTDLLSNPQEDFQKVSEYVLRKNEELYRRLS